MTLYGGCHDLQQNHDDQDGHRSRRRFGRRVYSATGISSLDRVGVADLAGAHLSVIHAVHDVQGAWGFK